MPAKVRKAITFTEDPQKHATAQHVSAFLAKHKATQALVEGEKPNPADHAGSGLAVSLLVSGNQRAATAANTLKGNQLLQQAQVLDPSRPSGLVQSVSFANVDGALAGNMEGSSNQHHDAPSTRRSTATSLAVPETDVSRTDVLTTIAATDYFLALRDFFAPPHTDSIRAVVADPEYTGRIYTASYDDTAGVWLYSSRERAGSLPHADWVNAIAVVHLEGPVEGDGLTAIARRSLNASGQRPSVRLSVPSLPSEAARQTLSVTYVVTGSEDGHVSLWSHPANKVVHQLTPCHGPITALTSSGDLVFAASLRTTYTISVVTGSVIREHTDVTDVVSLLSVGGHLLIGTADGRIVLWDIVEAIVLREIPGHKGGAVRCLLSASSLATAAGQSPPLSPLTGGNFDPAASSSSSSLQLHASSGRSPEHYSFQHTFFSAGDDGLIKVWALSTGTCLQVIHAHDEPVTALCGHYRGAELFLFTASMDGTIACHALRAGRSGTIHSVLATCMTVWHDSSSRSEPVLLAGDHSGLLQVLPILLPEANVIAGTCLSEWNARVECTI